MFAEDILKKFLLERGEDVQKIMMFDLTYEKQMENAKREWYNDGVEEGYSTGIKEGYSSGISKGDVGRLVNSIIKKLQKNSGDSGVAGYTGRGFGASVYHAS